MPDKKTAVVLFNLGGPNTLDAVRPFLFNLFYDPQILTLPNPFRYCLAKLISFFRTKEATEIYQAIGGKSPLLEETQAQAKALEDQLGDHYKVFVAMRHWHPFFGEIREQIRTFKPDQIVFLPLYPQLSSTTSYSFFKHIQDSFDVPVKWVGCYPELPGFVDFFAQEIEKAVQTHNLKDYRILCTAHSLPVKTVEKGDPYQVQVEKTFQKIKDGTKIEDSFFRLCYQSKVGPLKWLTPSTEQEIHKAYEDRKNVIVVPLSFVSEHSETLYELDLQYRKIYDQNPALTYVRIATPGSTSAFIKDLKKTVLDLAHGTTVPPPRPCSPYCLCV